MGLSYWLSCYCKKDPTSIRGRRVINDFCLDVRKGLIAEEMSIRSQLELSRLLKIADYRNIVAKIMKDGDNPPSTIVESNVTKHVKILIRSGYNLKSSLADIKQKKAKTHNFAPKNSHGKKFVSRYTDLTAAKNAHVLAQLDEKLLH